MMTLTEMQIAIAEADGWVPNGTGYWRRGEDVRALVEEPEDGESPWPAIRALPHYPSDLNLMHEVEKKLDSIRFGDDFGDYLAQIVLGFGPDHKGVICLNRWALRRLLHATALQHAEAFCRVIHPERFKP